MRDITIVGAGQGGLLLAHGLLDRGYNVTLATKFTPDQIARGRILSNQCMWGDARAIEKEFGLALWDNECPPIPGFDTIFMDKSGKALHRYPAPLTVHGQSIDQRLKFSEWLRLYDEKGGKLVYADVGMDELEQYAAQSDLVIVATGKGKGAMQGFFERDEERSPHKTPQRYGASIHVKNRIPDDRYKPEMELWAVIPEVGEFWIFPSLTVHGPGHVVCLQGVPGGPLDVWAGLDTVDAHSTTMMDVLRRWLPEEAERCKNMEPVDSKSWLSGGLLPAITHPVRRLPSGRHVMAIGDNYVLNDPISQQGTNNATRAAKLYLQRILDHDDEEFDEDWMTGTTDLYWDYAKWTVKLTDIYFSSPPEFQKKFIEAASSPEKARELADSNNAVIDFVKSLTGSEMTR